jgi:microcompartment protein CcmK/EutM
MISPRLLLVDPASVAAGAGDWAGLADWAAALGAADDAADAVDSAVTGATLK